MSNVGRLPLHFAIHRPDLHHARIRYIYTFDLLYRSQPAGCPGRLFQLARLREANPRVPPVSARMQTIPLPTSSPKRTQLLNFNTELSCVEPKCEQITDGRNQNAAGSGQTKYQFERH